MPAVRRESPHKDHIGKVFSRLTVISWHEYAEDKAGRRHAKYICRCSCGIEKSIKWNTIQSGKVRSCGCLLEEYRETIAPRVSRERNIKGLGEASFNRKYGDYRDRAKNLNVDFSLSKEEFKTITQMDCAYCGVGPSQICNPKGISHGSYIYNGIDRKDNLQGYTIENSQPCCGVCNKAKRNLTMGDFQEWINRLVLFQLQKAQET